MSPTEDGPTKAMPAADRQRRWLEKQKAKGLKRVEVRVPEEYADEIKRVAEALRAGATVSLTPANFETEELHMSQNDAPWNLQGLKEAIEQSDFVAEGEFVLEIIEGAEPVMVVRVPELGDLELFLSVNGEQIITSVLLWPCEDQEERAAFEGMMLRNHKKYLPLSALGITEIYGKEWYELFGTMSSRSVLQSVVTELRTVAQSAVDLSNDLAPGSAETAA